MADNVVTSAAIGTGVTLATDDIASVHYQRVKLALGSDGAATDALGGSGVDAAGVQRVSLATDVPLPAGSNAIGKLAANSGVDIGDVDVTSVIPGTGATNLGKAEDAAHVTGDTGVMALAVRSNTAASTSGADGDYQPLITNTTGHLWVDASGQTLTVGVHGVTDNGGSLTVDNAGTFAVQATIAAGATNIAKAEDVASADADVGVPAMAVRKATPANTSGTDGDYEMLQMSAGRLWTSTVVDTALPAGTNAIGKLAANSGVTIGAVEIAAAQTVATVTNVATIGTSVTPGTSAAHLGKAEDAAHSSGDTGVAVLAVRTDTATQRADTAGDYSVIQTDSRGKLWTRATPEGTDYETVAASATDQAMGATGATGDYLAGVLVIPGTTSPGAVSIKDGAGSAITIFTGGASSVSNLVPFMVPLGIISTGGAWKITTGANVTAIGVGTFT